MNELSQPALPATLNEIPQKSGREFFWASPHVLGLVLLVGTFVLYWPVTRNGFVDYDDGLYVAGNAQVQAGLTWEGVKQAFGRLAGEHTYWHPLTWLSHMADCQLFGLNAGAHHLVNVLFHGANVCLLFLILRKMTGNHWCSAMAAALYAWHPLQVGTVAWIAERKNVLSTCLWLLTLLAYWRYVQQPGVKRYGTVFVCFGLGLMAKPMLVTLPFVLLLLDFWPLRRLRMVGPDATKSQQPLTPVSLRRAINEKLPLLVLSVASAIITVAGHARLKSLAMGHQFPLEMRLENALVSYFCYIRKMVWPSDLAVLYPLFLGHRPVWQVIGAAVFLILVTAFAIWHRQKLPFMVVGWFWYLGTLVPVIGLVQAGSDSMADRYTYIPLIGLYICAAWGAGEIIRRWPPTKPLLIAAGGITLALCVALTRVQIGHWANSETLFRHAVTVTPNNWLLYNSLGGWLAREGRFAEAVDNFRAALRIHPKYQEAHYNLGIALVKLGRVDEGIREYELALRLLPDYTDAHINLGIALATKGQLEAAFNHFQTALHLDPNRADAWNNAANVLSQRGQLAEAVSYYQKSLAIQPDYPEAHFNLGVALEQSGQRERAIFHLNEALRLKPGYGKAENHLRNLLKAKPTNE